jgi:uncharacterized membrane protein YgaE (UPF0421/DUF939 family)
MRPAELRARITSVVRDPVAWTTGLQLVKTVVAAVLAWFLAASVLGLPQPFLAPWSAMLVVHFTVHQSMTRGLQQMVSAVVGVILGWAFWHLLGGLSLVTLGGALLVAMFFAQIRWVKEEGTTAATTALFVLTAGFGDNNTALLGRLADTAVGLGVGFAINLLVWPPLLDHSAARAIHRVRGKVGDLLSVIANECHDECTNEHVEIWIERSRELDEEIDDAWALVRQGRESGRFNLRKGAASVRQSEKFGLMLDRTEQSLSEIRSIARTLGHSVNQTNAWDSDFRERWTALLGETAWAIQNPDGRMLEEVRTKLSILADDYSDEDLSARHWPEYGGLLLNLRNIATEMDEIAETDPVSESSRGPMGSPAL